MKSSQILFSLSVLVGTVVPAKADFYLVGAATPAGWSENLPEEMVNLGNNCYLWDGWLEKGDFKFLSRRGDWGSSFVAPSENLNFESGKMYQILDASNPDYKFYNDRPGYRRIVVDLNARTVRIKRPSLSLIGPAASGWDLKKVIPVFADDEGLIFWEGMLNGGELKFLTGDDWQPCYNAPFEGDIMGAGGHMMCYREGEYDGNEYVDHKFIVPRAGLYSITFDLPDLHSDGAISVTVAGEPDLRGGFRAQAGRYVIALDSDAARMHMAAVPTQLFVGTGADSYQRLDPVGTGRFSSTVSLKSGSCYKLSYNPSRWDATAFSPNHDVDITATTSNVAPMHGYSYTVPESGQYVVTADFSGSTPTLQAVRVNETGIENVKSVTSAVVRAEGREIVVSGEFSAVAVYDMCGKLIGTASRTAVAPGIYAVLVDNVVSKIVIR